MVIIMIFKDVLMYALYGKPGNTYILKERL